MRDDIVLSYALIVLVMNSRISNNHQRYCLMRYHYYQYYMLVTLYAVCIYCVAYVLTPMCDFVCYCTN